MPDYQGSCFVIMSFADDDRLRDSYLFGVEQTVERLGYRCIRVDKQHFNGSIREYILQSLHEADFIVADVSHALPIAIMNWAWHMRLAKRLSTSPTRPRIFILTSRTSTSLSIRVRRIWPAS
ncbi:MAG: hypothetical protein HZT40_12005 [Candidatus Thiothrix singaporensis]|uniref:Uncharacterized protein n=1 Tax=Candidatus Thiothrix singaporensis TaxID=2799669 RepID=A0A7L6AT08_9GAMM|nr:MAG: hypothetical protein HZT40_12005 [Candidatus Thiothrix singaporensis]